MFLIGLLKVYYNTVHAAACPAIWYAIPALYSEECHLRKREMNQRQWPTVEVSPLRSAVAAAMPLLVLPGPTQNTPLYRMVIASSLKMINARLAYDVSNKRISRYLSSSECYLHSKTAIECKTTQFKHVLQAQQLQEVQAGVNPGPAGQAQARTETPAKKKCSRQVLVFVKNGVALKSLPLL